LNDVSLEKSDTPARENNYYLPDTSLTSPSQSSSILIASQTTTQSAGLAARFNPLYARIQKHNTG
jgi:hypothetical protein